MAEKVNRNNSTIMDWKNFKCTILVGSQLSVTCKLTSDVKQKGKKRERGRKKKKNGIFHVKASFARKSLRRAMRNYSRQTAQYNNRECCTSKEQSGQF